MSVREQLHAYITQREQRLRWSTLLRGLAILTGSALLATLALVAIANALAFSHGSVTAARFGLILVLAIPPAAGLALPLRRLTRRRAVGTAEAAFPQFQQRLITFAERDGRDPFIELLAADTLNVAQSAEPKLLVTDRRLQFSLGAALGALAILIWMIAAGPGFLGYGASLLWTGPRSDQPATPINWFRRCPSACSRPTLSCMPASRVPPSGKRLRCSSRRPAISRAAIN